MSASRTERIAEIGAVIEAYIMGGGSLTLSESLSRASEVQQVVEAALAKSLHKPLRDHLVIHLSAGMDRQSDRSLVDAFNDQLEKLGIALRRPDNGRPGKLVLVLDRSTGIRSLFVAGAKEAGLGQYVRVTARDLEFRSNGDFWRDILTDGRRSVSRFCA
jgi:hypothetical protein